MFLKWLCYDVKLKWKFIIYIEKYEDRKVRCEFDISGVCFFLILYSFVK